MSPGSLSDEHLMMKVFNEEFSADFMIAVLPLHVQCIKQPIQLSLKPSSPLSPHVKSQPRAWPKFITEETKKHCVKSYWDATVWTPPSVCAVCAQERSEARMKTCTIQDDCTHLPLSLEDL